MRKEEQNNLDDMLLERLRKGDVDALNALFNKYYVPLCCYSIQIIDNEVEAEDIVQNLFVSLLGKQRFNSITTLRNYLFNAVKNASLTAVKKRGRMVDLESSLDINAYADPNEQCDIEEMEERIRLMKESLKVLSPKEYDVLMSIIVDGRKYKDVAQDMNVSVNTIKSHLLRATRKLRFPLVWLV